MNVSIDKQTRIFGWLLYFFACWTLLIKYVLPISWAFKLQEPWISYIYFWDAWWLAHLYVGWGLRHKTKMVWQWAMLLSIAEIGIITVKFVAYIPNPNLDFWHLSWFVNKCFLLVYFWILFAWLLKKEVKVHLGKT